MDCRYNIYGKLVCFEHFLQQKIEWVTWNGRQYRISTNAVVSQTPR